MQSLIDTRGLTHRDQFAFYEAALRSRLAPFQLARPGASGAPFAATLKACQLAGMDVIHGRGGAHAIGQSRDCGAANPYRYGLVMALHGCLAVQVLQQRTDVIPPGALVLTDNHQLPGWLRFPRQMNVLTLQLPESCLPGEAAARLAQGPVVFSAAQRHARLLGMFVAGLPRHLDPGRPDTNMPMDTLAHASQLRGLLTLALREQGVQAEAPLLRGDMEDVYARAAVMVMARRKSCAALTPARLAAELGVSERHLFRVLSGQGLRFGTLLLRQRLDAAAAALRAPENAERSLLDIALAQGFLNQSHFSRAFREAYGCPPGVFRAMAV